ncbi:MAG TPA: hypothetical protein VK731_09005, partial [Candidatus Cybelea sp.]|nr:hypothetical protein [Candidatus Cybelea sp.]
MDNASSPVGQTPSKPKMYSRILSAFVVLLVILVFLVAAFPGHGPKREGNHLISWIRMNNIAVALEMFRRANSRHDLPHRISELFPSYLEGTDAVFFQSRYTTSVMPNNATSQLELIDIFSPYAFAELPD